MHGLVNRSLQHFVCDTHGPAAWEEVCARAGVGFTEFEAMMRYDFSYTPQLVGVMPEVFGRPRGEILEDFGTYLVTNPQFPAVRRLLRFSGVTFTDFLHSLDDLPGRVRLAVPDLHLPALSLRGSTPDRFHLVCQGGIAGFGHAMLGVLRAMADDYGVLVLLDHIGRSGDDETISISLVEADFAVGRHFELGAGLA